MAEQVKVDPGLFAKYELSSRAAKYHRGQIREELGFRECTKAEQVELAGWLSRELCPTEIRRDQLRDAVIARSPTSGLEPPTFGQLARLVNSAVRQLEERFCRDVERRLDAYVGLAGRLEAVIGAIEHAAGPVAGGGGARFLHELKTDPGPLGTETFRHDQIDPACLQFGGDLGQVAHRAGQPGQSGDDQLANRRRAPLRQPPLTQRHSRSFSTPTAGPLLLNPGDHRTAIRR